MIENTAEQKKAYLISVHIKGEDFQQTEYSLEELAALTKTLGIEVVGSTIQVRDKPDQRTFIGKGKLAEIKEFLEKTKVDFVFFDKELPPKQSQNLEIELQCPLLDRSQVILEIFAQNAKTATAKLQVELARLYYMMPRLVGLWAHLDREKGGIGTSKGMGEKQVNIDRTLIRKRIRQLETALKKIHSDRQNRTKQRQNCFKICLVGYTNAGKSTIMNLLSEENLLTEDKLFATLESTTRVLKDLTKPDLLISDTVGFIKNLPHSLVASFRSTLEVIKEADLLLQVMDASDPELEQHMETTAHVLEEIGADDIPVILVLNKIDRLEDKMPRLLLKKSFPDALLISALNVENKAVLEQKIRQFFLEQFVSTRTILSYQKSDLLSQIYELTMVNEIKYEEDGIHLDLITTQINQKRLTTLLV